MLINERTGEKYQTKLFPAQLELGILTKEIKIIDNTYAQPLAD